MGQGKDAAATVGKQWREMGLCYRCVQTSLAFAEC